MAHSYKDGDKSSIMSAIKAAPKPKINQKTVYCMEPSGLYGSVYEDPRGLGGLKIALIGGLTVGLIVLAIAFIWINATANAVPETPDAVKLLDEPVERNIPILSQIIGTGDQEIYDQYAASNTMYQTSIGTTGLEAVRISEGLTAEDLAIFYMEGFSNISLEDLANLLRGSWFFSTNRGTYTTMKVKYADFTSKSIENAITLAVHEQGFDVENCSVLLSGVDDNDNTYQYGTVPVGENVFYWRVAACPLKAVYNVNGLPEDAVYIGITLCTAAFLEVPAEGSNTTNSAAS